MRDVDRTAYPQDLESAEAKLITERRSRIPELGAAQPPDPSRLPEDAMGFGLSGGGIRSATFCFGLFQSLAEASLLRRIDFVSTVSGGGYFGAFLGRLFTREWVRGVDDVESAIQGDNPPSTAPETLGWANRMFRWLRDNGRYLAPRGSGDFILLGAILLRNWIAVQVVMITSVLTVFVALQLVRPWLDAALQLNRDGSLLGTLLICTLPFGNSLLLWSPWIVLLIPILVLIAVPAGWAYWLVPPSESGKNGVPAAVGAVGALLIGVAGTIRYQHSAGSQWVVNRLPDPGAPWVSTVAHPVRFWFCLVATIVVVAAMVYWLSAHLWMTRKTRSDIEYNNLLRAKLTTYLKFGLLGCGAVLLWTCIDTAGASLYAISRQGDLTRWGASLFAAFAAMGAFARSIAVLLIPKQQRGRPPVPVSIVSWVGAVVVLGCWLTGINVVSHAVAWQFKPMSGVPRTFTVSPEPKILGADRVEMTAAPTGLVVRAVNSPEPCEPSKIERPSPDVALAAFFLLAVFTWLFGRTNAFANMSSLHGFYAARLTRTFLGASNPNRLETNDSAINESMVDDDCTGSEYWQWPELEERSASERSAQRTPTAKPWTKGGPLHLINTTVNETMDARTKVQNQDRKGTGFALGPCALSLGIRHHLVDKAGAPPAIFPVDGFRVFRSAEENGRTPEPLSLGRWMSISGAAFSAAAGANTTVPIAILAGMLNVRLGYWWDSGTPADAGPLSIGAKRWTPWVTFEALLPVQSALLSEMLARTRGTAGQLWNLSDGGHFENMGGYELIRRRLPLIVIVDAEADPDYEFRGLSDLVRKARLDFNAEITFLSTAQLADRIDEHTPVLPESVQPYFGDLDSLRRGRWSDEAVPGPDGGLTRYTLDVDRSRVSRAHAALATIAHSDSEARSWLVYIKATLTGDEPEDVCHYHRAHPAFPQETTNDQFFDEAQWESYRRLGVHIGHRVLTPALFDHLQRVPPPN
jgi:hypothetical protein